MALVGQWELPFRCFFIKTPKTTLLKKWKDDNVLFLCNNLELGVSFVISQHQQENGDEDINDTTNKMDKVKISGEAKKEDGGASKTAASIKRKKSVKRKMTDDEVIAALSKKIYNTI